MTSVDSYVVVLNKIVLNDFIIIVEVYGSFYYLIKNFLEIRIEITVEDPKKKRKVDIVKDIIVVI